MDWLVLREGALEVRRHEGAGPLPKDLQDRKEADKPAIAHFMLKDPSEYTDAEREHMRVSETYGFDWYGFIDRYGYTPPEARE